jgi:hypothetical protein
MLKEEIDAAKRAVNTDTVQMTIGEVNNMYASKELNILPDFQRLFRWTNDRKSNFIESILIGIPVPPVFVYENENGTWELIDGLQRISTLLEFMGVLRDVDSGELLRSQLQNTKYLPSLRDVVWETKANGEVQIDKALQLFFRRARLDFQILKHPSDPKTKFDLFQRLNRGGAYANEQEVRTCSMVLANAEFTQAIRQVAQRDDAVGIFRITAVAAALSFQAAPDQERQAYDRKALRPRVDQRRSGLLGQGERGSARRLEPAAARNRAQAASHGRRRAFARR